VDEIREEELLQSRWPQRRIHSSGVREWWSAFALRISQVRKGTASPPKEPTREGGLDREGYALTAIRSKKQKTAGDTSEATNERNDLPGASCLWWCL
jgi:hypothetical protein